MIAGGVPLKIDEPWDGGAPTFRIGLFGLDKLLNVDKTARIFEEAVASIMAEEGGPFAAKPRL